MTFLGEGEQRGCVLQGPCRVVAPSLERQPVNVNILVNLCLLNCPDS